MLSKVAFVFIRHNGQTIRVADNEHVVRVCEYKQLGKKVVTYEKGHVDFMSLFVGGSLLFLSMHILIVIRDNKEKSFLT